MKASQADRLRLETETEHIVDQMKSLGAVKVILFGSLARQQISLFSDIDLLVIMPEGTPRLDTAEKLHMKMFGIPAAVDFLVATPSDLYLFRA